MITQEARGKYYNIPIDLSGFQEMLATLYLRLNGYFTSGFIIHDNPDAKTDLDVMAVRFPFNSEPEREIMVSEYLQIPQGKIDLLICEVKGGEDNSPQFNEALLRDPQPLISALRWAGVLPDEIVNDVASHLVGILKPKIIESSIAFKGFEFLEWNLSIRGILFSIDQSSPRRNQPRYIYGDEILKYIWDCLCPTEARDRCAFAYDFGLWGVAQPLVEYFKNRKKVNPNEGPGKLDDIYRHFGYRTG